jgi:hypothetical protein
MGTVVVLMAMMVTGSLAGMGTMVVLMAMMVTGSLAATMITDLRLEKAMMVTGSLAGMGTVVVLMAMMVTGSLAATMITDLRLEKAKMVGNPPLEMGTMVALMAMMVTGSLAGMGTVKVRYLMMRCLVVSLVLVLVGRATGMMMVGCHRWVMMTRGCHQWMMAKSLIVVRCSKRLGSMMTLQRSVQVMMTIIAVSCPWMVRAQTEAKVV